MAIDSASIAEAFSEAATRYDDVAAVQRWAAQQLLARMSPVSGRYLRCGLRHRLAGLRAGAAGRPAAGSGSGTRDAEGRTTPARR